MFSWFYTDRFVRLKRFRRLVRNRTTNFRSFLDFCTTLETLVPVILYRLHFVENMEDGFAAIAAGCVFKNGFRVQQSVATLNLGDFIEIFYADVLKLLSIIHLIRCLPTLRIRLTLEDSIVNTAMFYSQFVRFYSILAVFSRQNLHGLQAGFLNQRDLEKTFFINIFQYFSLPLSRMLLERQESTVVTPVLKSNQLTRFWWGFGPKRLLLSFADNALSEENYDLSDFPTTPPEVTFINWDSGKN
jgi:hypothetical protein